METNKSVKSYTRNVGGKQVSVGQYSRSQEVVPAEGGGFVPSSPHEQGVTPFTPTTHYKPYGNMTPEMAATFNKKYPKRAKRTQQVQHQMQASIQSIITKERPGIQKMIQKEAKAV